MRDLWKPFLAILVCCFGVAGMLSGRPIARAPGVLVEQEPLQTLISSAAPFAIGEFELTPRARYDITARVLSVESYKMDGGAKLSPLDFAVGWGPDVGFGGAGSFPDHAGRAFLHHLSG